MNFHFLGLILDLGQRHKILNQHLQRQPLEFNLQSARLKCCGNFVATNEITSKIYDINFLNQHSACRQRRKSASAAIVYRPNKCD